MLGSGEFEDDPREIDGLGVLLALLTALPLLGRRRWPLVVFPLVWIPTVIIYAMGYSFGPPVGSIDRPLRGRSPRRATAAPPPVRTALVVAGGLLLFVLISAGFGEFPFVELIFAVVTWGGSWVRRRPRSPAARAPGGRAGARRADRERRLAAAEERTRIARDLHDSAGHAINVILVQAGAARLLQRAGPRARPAGPRDHRGGRPRDPRRHRSDGPGRCATRAPPGSSRPPACPRWTASPSATGPAACDVSAWTCAAAPRPLPRASTAPPTASSRRRSPTPPPRGRLGAVEVTYGPEAVEITVTNPTARERRRAPGGGHGIVGMRERASLLGGTLEAGGDGRRLQRQGAAAVPEHAGVSAAPVRVLIVDDDASCAPGCARCSRATRRRGRRRGRGRRGRPSHAPGGCARTSC